MNKQHLGGFEQARGERQVTGTPGIVAVTPQPGNIPIGPAPPHIRQVLSVYDSRPIGGYDFVLTGSFAPYISAPQAFVQSPKGYVAVLRRIELFAYPAFLNTSAPAWSFVANGVAATAWDWVTSPAVDADGIDVFFVIAPDQPFGIRAALNAFNVGGSSIYVRYIGNLLLDSNEPPSEQVGQLPHAVFPIVKEF